MAHTPERAEVPAVEPPAETAGLADWLSDQRLEAERFVAANKNDTGGEQNRWRLKQIMMLQETARTPEELALWERFVSVETFVRGLIDADRLPPIDQQLTTLRADQEITEKLISDARQLSSTSAFATLLCERLISISADLQLRIRRLDRQQHVM